VRQSASRAPALLRRQGGSPDFVCPSAATPRRGRGRDHGAFQMGFSSLSNSTSATGCCVSMAPIPVTLVRSTVPRAARTCSLRSSNAILDPFSSSTVREMRTLRFLSRSAR
jgi:hypothetical protein